MTASKVTVIPIDSWIVFDPNPTDQDGPAAFGPFRSEAEAWEYANLTHPEDMSGNTVVLRLVKP